jgi:pimeloyl-ACP methyl ester carboxylesterase
MKTVLLHGLGQTAKDWAAIAKQLSSDADCPELFALAQSGLSYPQILAGLEKCYADTAESLRICGLSLGGMLALDYAIRHGEKVDSLILIGIQCKVSRLLVDFQNLLFRWMPDKAFADTGLSKRNTINLAHSMRELDFTGKLQEVKCPVTLLCGEKDRPNRAAAKQLKKLLPQAELLIVPGAGHEVNQDAPEVIVELLSR